MFRFVILSTILFHFSFCEKVFVSWTRNSPTEKTKYQSFVMPGSYGYVVDYTEKHPQKKKYTVLVQMKKMPYDTGYIGIGWNNEPKMKNASMMILTNNPWDNNQWTLGEYHSDDNSSPKLIKKENATISIVNGTLQFEFDTNDDVENMYFFYAYANKWGFHGDNKGISYEPLRNPVSSPLPSSSPIIKQNNKSPPKQSPSPRYIAVFSQSPPQNKPEVQNSSAISAKIGYIVYIVAVFALILL
jgi:hypothetical protein